MGAVLLPLGWAAGVSLWCWLYVRRWERSADAFRLACELARVCEREGVDQ